MAGVAGLEPTNARIKTWCLTNLAIPLYGRPIIHIFFLIASFLIWCYHIFILLIGSLLSKVAILLLTESIGDCVCNYRCAGSLMDGIFDIAQILCLKRQEDTAT